MQRRGFRSNGTAKFNIDSTFIPNGTNKPKRCGLEVSANTQYPTFRLRRR